MIVAFQSPLTNVAYCSLLDCSLLSGQHLVAELLTTDVYFSHPSKFSEKKMINFSLIHQIKGNVVSKLSIVFVVI